MVFSDLVPWLASGGCLIGIGTLAIQSALVRAWNRAQKAQFAPTQLPPAPHQNLDIGACLETVLVKGAETQLSMLDKMNQLSRQNLEMAMESMAKTGKRLGGKLRARGPRTVAGQFATRCRLCANAAIADPTPAEIIAHHTHTPAYSNGYTRAKKRERAGEAEAEEATSPQPRSIPPRPSFNPAAPVFSAGGGPVPMNFTLESEQVQRGQDGTEFVECPECGEPKIEGHEHIAVPAMQSTT